MRRIFALLPVLALAVLGTLSCDKEKEDKRENGIVSGPQIVTLSADKGPFRVVILSGCVIGLEDVALDFKCGIDFSTDSIFSRDYATRKVVDTKFSEDSNHSYSYSITLYIQPGKKYFYRAFYFNQKVMYYGEVKTFTFEWTTSEIDKSMVSVDLGLSVKWASCNIGAGIPEDYGDYFAWGETEPHYEAGYAQESPQAHWKDGKFTYSFSTYKYCNGSLKTMTKYCNNSSYGNNGFTDSKTTLDPDDDVAHVKWGGSWRMPTADECQELLDNCSWTWTTQNGVNGFMVTSKKSGFEGASIFLPAGGFHAGGSFPGRSGSEGNYWSSSLHTYYPYDGWSLYFSQEKRYTSGHFRYAGYSVRPVCP